MDEYWEIWTLNTPEEGPPWRNRAFTLTSESNAIRLCTAEECPYPGAEIWHVQYGLDGTRTATQVTY